jgi:hypothetical protein
MRCVPRKMPFEKDAFFCLDLLSTEAVSLPMHTNEEQLLLRFYRIPGRAKYGRSEV